MPSPRAAELKISSRKEKESNLISKTPLTPEHFREDHSNPYPFVVAIDGPAASGKSTVSRLLAQRLGFLLLDTGALYRVMALHLLRNGVSAEGGPISEAVLSSMDLRVEPEVGSMRLFLAGEDVSEVIRGDQIGSIASRFSARPEVRRALLELQRQIGAMGNVIAEGRDMGTVVFPDAAVKFFVCADLRERAGRRYRELVQRGEQTTLEEVLEDMRQRDERDESRKEAPMVQAPDAISVDTTGLDPEQVVEQLLSHIARKRSALPGGRE
ncbi:MAG: (d)CMP kinase [Thermodesulfobacteriota bacterium]